MSRVVWGFCLSLTLLFLVSLSNSQEIGSFEEVTAGNSFGVGARQMSMGGVGIATSLDGASLYHNPACLTRLSAVEFQLGWTAQQFNNRSSQSPNRFSGFNSVLNQAEAKQNKTRFASAILTAPIPTYRGSFVVAGGITKIMSFNRVAELHVIDQNMDGLVVDDYSSESEEGAVYAYTAGGAIDLTPHVSVGLSISVLSGDDRFRFENYYTDQTQTLNYIEGSYGFVNESYIGVTAKAGLLFRPNSNIAWGLTIESPLRLEVEYSYEEDWYQTDTSGVVQEYYDEDFFEYSLTHPPKLGTGFSFRFATFTLAADVEYADWSQLEYHNNVNLEADNDSLKALYRDVINWRAGIEYQYPKWGLALRSGFFLQPLPYNKANFKNDRVGYSFGIGWLTGGHLMLEAAYSTSQFDRLYTSLNDALTLAEDDYKRVYLTISYR